ncbi:endonuclease NucS domain-containing protein [Bacillus sp. JJ722]|uniref:endonuclease NucS domain-containing protein n=1 Tax=Bacillus sp. JJ722 TaxID=3122973 RepID=UPI002FFF2693
MLINQNPNNINNRCICLFESYPSFFKEGIDMDDVLASNPISFKMLRAFWKRSFIKIDEEENKALKDIILKRNEEYIKNKYGCYNSNLNLHQTIRENVSENYHITSKNLLSVCANNNFIKHEMAIEAGIIDIITNNDKSIFGKWDYLSHQVIASPFKPIDYMDKMDVFGFRYIPGFDTISKYLLIEIKSKKADVDAINQLMKYVDWINQEYSFGDYSMIQAFLVAYDIPKNVIEHRNSVCKRNYLKGRRPAISAEWSYVKLIKYSFDDELKELVFEEVN